MKASKEVLLADSATKYIESFESARELLNNFKNIKTCPIDKGLAIINCILEELPNKFFSKINRIHIHQSYMFDGEYHDSYILLETDNESYDLYSDYFGRDENDILFKRKQECIVEDGFAVRNYDQHKLDCAAIHNIALLIDDLTESSLVVYPIYDELKY